MRAPLALLGLAALLSPLPVHGESYAKICNGYYIKKESTFGLSFSDNEKIFICGDNTPGWKNVPQNQAIYHLRNFLTSRGYYQPKIRKSNNEIYVDPGSRAFLKKIEFQNEPQGFGDVSYKAALDKVLNSELLTEIQKWNVRRLRALGYPCPQIEISASYEEEKALVILRPGKKVTISEIQREDLKSFDEKALKRFDAIRSGDLYNGDFLDLTSRRLMASGIANYSYFKDSCKGQGASPDKPFQKVYLGTPQSLILAGGASTEEFPIFKATWKHMRLDHRASTVQAKLYTSPLKQSVTSDIHWYWFDKYPRLYFNPELKIQRISEDVYEAIFQQYALGAGYVHDSATNQYILRVAPTYNVEKTIEGPSAENINYLSLESRLTLTSHYYEYYQTSPRTGFDLNFHWSSRQKGLGSEVSGDKFRISGTYLINIGRFDPPVVVFGARMALASIRSPNLKQTPQSFRLYLGGDRNIRGFPRNSINNHNNGYLTSSYLGFESRFVTWLPYKLQPFLLLDFAKVGTSPFEWLDPLLYAPGLGLRWQSPIGTFRATAARGHIAGKEDLISEVRQEWVYFINYGREF